MKLIIDNTQKVFFTSDTHYGHSNICSATTNWKGAENLTRKFDSLSKMNDAIVNNINSVVGVDDILFHDGDWSFGGIDNISLFLNRLVCKNIYIIPGNHDHHIKNNKDGVGELFTEVLPEITHLDLRIKHNKKSVEKFNFILSHYPLASWENMNQGWIHLHGHVHLSPHHRITGGKAMDVGMEGNNLFPNELREIIKIMKGQDIRMLKLPKDHHEKRV